ncbi:MAG: superoxide dismutase family protein [Gemmatimonadaceae bacterium]
MITRRRRSRLILVCTLASAACHQAARTAAESPAGAAVVRSASGMSRGTLRLEQGAGGVRVSGTLAGLPAGVHGVHFHQVGRCDAPDFATAGAHFNPTGALHGLDNPLGPHAGDLPNITTTAGGQVAVDVVTMRVTLDASGPRGLFDGDGTALVIHAAPDDQRSDPAGNSGARIACGVVTRADRVSD